MTDRGEKMRRLITVFTIALFLTAGLACGASAATINGAGATFPYPLYARWSFDYAKDTGLKLNYQSIGSGGGIKQIRSGTVDFGASDAPLTAKELNEYGLIQFPRAIGGVVPVVNIKGVGAGQLKLTPAVLAGIYLGEIVKWSDKKLAEINPGLGLPDEAITVVHRSDGSGTTWIFTNYLAKVSKGWEQKAGFGTSVSWPAGVGGKGNEGVATYVKRMPNTIGYVEFAYALQNKLVHVRLENRSKNFIEPTTASFAAAGEGADWKGTPGFSVILTDQPGKDAWPVAGATFILVYKKPADCVNAKAALDFFDWSYKNGAASARALDYVAIPKKVFDIMEESWAKEIKCNGKPLWKM